MNAKEIQFDIRERILKSNQTFTNNLGKIYHDGLLSDDIVLLKKLLKKITSKAKFYYIAGFISSVCLVIFSCLKSLEILNVGNMNKASIFISVVIMMLIGAYRLYKIKVNLEFKIYLLGLLNKVDET